MWDDAAFRSSKESRRVPFLCPFLSSEGSLLNFDFMDKAISLLDHLAATVLNTCG